MLEKKKAGGGGELADLGMSSPVSSAAVLVVVGASDVALPHCHWWVWSFVGVLRHLQPFWWSLGRVTWRGHSGGHWGE